MTQAEYLQESTSSPQEQLEMINVYSVFSVHENNYLRKKLYAESELRQPRGQPLKGQARLLTTDEIREPETERAAEKAEKEQERFEKQEPKLHEEAGALKYEVHLVTQSRLRSR